MDVYDCTACGACCREAFDAVEIDDDDPFVRLHSALVITTPFGRTGVRRDGERCACLVVQGGTYTCRVYADRPQTCHDVEVDGQACRWARVRVGLPVRSPDADDDPQGS